MHLVEAEETADLIDHSLETIQLFGETYFIMVQMAPSFFKGFLGFRSNPAAPNDLPSNSEANSG